MWVRKTNNEIITHIISECPKPLHEEYKQQHDWMGRTVHWNICRFFRFVTLPLEIPKKTSFHP